MRHAQRRYSRAGIDVIALAVGSMLALVGLPAPTASAHGLDSCPLEATIASLQACVQHAADMGFIGNQGVTQSLLAKLDAVQAAVDQSQPGVAVQVVQAFEDEVTAQAGKHIDPEHAQHMLLHAQIASQALLVESQ